MSEIVTVHGYTNNGSKGQRPRKPLVHIISSGGDFGEVQSISFHPDDAYAVASAIFSAAKASEAGLRRKAVTIELKPKD